MKLFYHQATQLFLPLIISISPLALFAQGNGEDTIPVRTGIVVQKPIYTQTPPKHNSFYNWMWGKHYRDLYSKTISVKTISLKSLYGGLSVVEQIPQLHTLKLKDKSNREYLLKPLGGSSSFLESNFFKNIYKQDDLKDTYVGDFISEAYTIIHPYSFITSESLAKAAGLNSNSSQIVYISGATATDTIADGSLIRNKLASISQLPDLKKKTLVTDTDSLLSILHKSGIHKVDQQIYIRTRLFDMLIGDWNKIPENWNWISGEHADSTIFVPYVLDRSNAFSKVDGVFFKELLNMIGVGFITNYEADIKNIKKFNQLGYALDIAVTQQSDINTWLEQAKYLKDALSDNVINNAFLKMPKEVKNEETESIIKNLKKRRDNIDNIALRYFTLLQNTPVITGTDKNDRFVIEQNQDNKLNIRIYDDNNALLLDRTYDSKHTKEIWIYGLNGNDTFEINKPSVKTPLLVIGGQGINNYEIKNGYKTSVYESKEHKEQLNATLKAKLIYPNDEKALDYDYQRLRHTKLAFTPIGIYDSDLGLNLGTSVTYTIYGFRRAPFTRSHQFSYNYSSGFTYQGIFPSYDEKKSFHLSAFVGTSAYFNNFFGFGNETGGYKNEQKEFNRVNIGKYTLTPAFYYTINKDQEIYVSSSFQIFKVDNPDGRNRYINRIYDDNNSIFDTKYYLDLGVTYDIDQRRERFVSQFKFMLSSGWTLNLADSKKNFPYAASHLGVNLKLTDRITFATIIKGRALFTDKYEFFQSATTELRGFRDNRFIGKQSLYQYSDIRLDLGRLENPLTPLNYGVFTGVDHGRVWYPGENSKKWHTSYGGGFWLTLFRKYTGKFSYFGSNDGSRFSFELGMGF